MRLPMVPEGTKSAASLPVILAICCEARRGEAAARQGAEERGAGAAPGRSGKPKRWLRRHEGMQRHVS